jgi:hypothetical protein
VTDLQGRLVQGANIDVRTFGEFDGKNQVKFLSYPPMIGPNKKTDEQDRWISPVVSPERVMPVGPPQQSTPGSPAAGPVDKKSSSMVKAAARQKPDWNDTRIPRKYVVDISADGYVPEFTRWVSSAREQGRVELDVRLRKLFPHVGKVIDLNGEPIAGVRIFGTGEGPERKECLSDKTGSFRLEGLPDGRIVSYAEKDGWYLTGQVVDERPITFKLAPKSAPNPERMSPQPPSPRPAVDLEFKRKARESAIAEAEKNFELVNEDDNFS